MPALNKAPIVSAWRFIIARHPTAFTFSAVAYTGFLSDINNTMDLGLGGFTQNNDTRLFCLRADFAGAVPVEGDHITIASVIYRIAQVTKVFVEPTDVFGLVFTLEGLAKP